MPTGFVTPFAENLVLSIVLLALLTGFARRRVRAEQAAGDGKERGAAVLEDVVGFLAEAGHERAAASVDARSAALAALPESVARLKARGTDCRVLFLEANPQSLMRRFSETRRRHPLTVVGLTLAEAIESERKLLGGFAELGHRIDTSELQPKVLRNWIRDLLGLSGGSLTLLFESFAFRDGIPLDSARSSCSTRTY